MLNRRLKEEWWRSVSNATCDDLFNVFRDDGETTYGA